MNAQNVNQILDALAAQFGSTGAHLWAVLMRQVYVDAVRYTVFAVLCLVASLVFAKQLRLKWKAWYQADMEVLVIIGACLLFVSTLILTVNAVNCLTQLANPEYGALSYVLDALKPK